MYSAYPSRCAALRAASSSVNASLSFGSTRAYRAAVSGSIKQPPPFFLDDEKSNPPPPTRASVSARSRRRVSFCAATSTGLTYFFVLSKSAGVAVSPPVVLVFLKAPDASRHEPRHIRDVSKTVTFPPPRGVSATPKTRTASRSACAPKPLGSYAIATFTVWPGSTLPTLGSGLKNVPREKAKSTGISSLTLRKVTRWSPRSRAAISPKSSSGGSTTSAATTARACTGRRNGFTGGPFASNETIARSFTSRVEALVACRASVAFNSRRSPYRSFPVPVARDLNPFAALSFVERSEVDGKVGFIVNVTLCFSYGSNAPSDGITASVVRDGRSALSSARSFTAKRVGYGELLYTAPLTIRVSPQSTCPKSTARIGNGSVSNSSVRNSGARGTTVAVAQRRADDDCEKKSFATFASVAEVVATSTSTETSPGSFGFKNAVTSTDFPGSTVANLGSTRNTSRSTRRSQLH
mmetsp:Transcript_15181/g.65002  ORF Transcript_15181/g.65002 Transcript_15181/m.65002 type:complete len:466 (+) Transcript_15181:8389-9786(+)